jgi:rhodanese-related sulfurtransferase
MEMTGMKWTNSAKVTPSQAGCRQIDSGMARELLRDNDALVIDVREPLEYAAGRIPGAELIPLRRIVQEVDYLKQHGERPIIISCRSGKRSEMACRFLRESGIENVYNLTGGVSAWRTANLALAQ